jgi:hypothetical protein
LVGGGEAVADPGVAGPDFLIDGFPEHFSAGGWTECV